MVDRLLLKVLQLAGVDPSHNEAHPKVPLFAGYLILSAPSAALGGRGGTEAALATRPGGWGPLQVTLVAPDTPGRHHWQYAR